MTLKNCIRNHYLVAFFVSLVISIGLIVGGFLTPPQGEIDGSVLKGVGELFLYPALAFAAKALDDDRKIRLQHGNTTITVGKTDEPHGDEVPEVEEEIEGEQEEL